jgi:hypothetical protein
VALKNVIRSEADAPTNKRRFIVQLICCAGCAAVGFASRDFLLSASADRRFVLYNVMKELRKDMPRSDVHDIVDRHYAPFVEKREWNDNLALSVWLSAMKTLTIKITFEEEKLARAEFFGIDSPSDLPSDAPSPIF